MTALEEIMYPTKKDITDGINKMIKNLDEDEEDYIGYHMKHYKSNWFFEIWDILKKYPVETIEKIIDDDSKLKPLVDSLNWTLISRLCDFNDEKFMKLFKHNLRMSFAKDYNPTYKDLDF